MMKRSKLHANENNKKNKQLLFIEMANSSIKVLLVFLMSMGAITATMNAQAPSITLDQVLRAARNGSLMSLSAEQQIKIAEQDLLIFKSRLKPSLFLEGRIPGYFSSSTAITQPNGTIEFQRISQNNASISLFAQQTIHQTGTQIFIQSDLQRFDDFTFDNRLYNGIPLRVGISQPIFGFNALKWDKKIAPIAIKEAQLQYNFDMENTQFQAAFLYFQILTAEENRKIAQLNTEVNENLIQIANKRLELGKISEDEKMQLEIELENAKVNLRNSEFELEATKNRLWTLIGTSNNEAPTSLLEKSTFEIPAAMPQLIINEEEAVQMALLNRPEIIAYQRRVLESEQNMARIKAATGPQVNLFASFGLARGSNRLEQIYSDPFTEQQLSLTFSVPLVDWGNRKSNRKKALLQLESTLTTIQQEKAEIAVNTRLTVREFLLLQETLADQQAIKELAQKRFQIANERYILGAISITDFTLAQREKDQTRRNYIQTLSNYWNSYYTLRLLTGYDFANNQKITY